ncbi:cytochrome P450 [Nocardia asteroides]|uniref:cytochrome P450 n=1 Tax=Nocardia asteroides TaxID=1824 RepID=UPI001E52CA58|nr:cytochrome P450 [Nocardia asteroides]UGT63076.1 cytochrome P450 [Nocardia asteroides]
MPRIPLRLPEIGLSTTPTDFDRTDEQRVPLWADPEPDFARLREKYGALVPVELAPGVPATLVIGYRVALSILNDPERFPADPRAWEPTVPPECPVLPQLRWQPNAMRNAGFEHARLRGVLVAALDEVDLHAVHTVVERTAVPLINGFCGDGAADLVAGYAGPLVFAVINALLGCPPEISARAAAGLAELLGGAEAEHGWQAFRAALDDLVRAKRERAGTDVTSALLRHGNALDDEELLQQIYLIFGVGTEPVQALIVNALRLVLTDARFDATLGGSLSTRDALDQVLFHDPPPPNKIFSYPRQPVLIGNTWLAANRPVVISLTGCNRDPEIAGDRTGNRAHLAWSAGPHACPARSLAYLIAQTAVDQLLDALPELELAVPEDELRSQTGPLYRALAELPVTFPPAAPLPPR